jgi:hypothetical protein
MNTCDAGVVPRSAPQQSSAPGFPGWFTDFLADRAVRKPSPHTTKAYRQNFEAIGILIAGTADAIADLRVNEVTKDKLRSAFAAYAETHSSASIRRCWSTWNTLCTFLFTAELLDANPMPLIGRPKVPNTLPKSYPANAVTDLVAAIDTDHGSGHRSHWPGRDRAIVFTSVTFAEPTAAVCYTCAARATRTAGSPSAQNFSTFSTTIYERAPPAFPGPAGEQPAATR